MVQNIGLEPITPRLRVACSTIEPVLHIWQRGKDSNLKRQSQSLLCCQLHHPSIKEKRIFECASSRTTTTLAALAKCLVDLTVLNLAP